MCTDCGQEFPNKQAIDLHFITTTGGECKGNFKVVYLCKICRRIFTRKDNLREHLRWHIAEDVRS